MKIKLHYQDGVLNLPAGVIELLPRADGDAVKILLCLADGGTLTREKIAQTVGCQPSDVDEAIAFWRGAGILDTDPAERERKHATSKRQAAPPPAPAVRVEASDAGTGVENAPAALSSVPQYTTDELCALLESRRELSSLIHECNNVLGKILNTHEVNMILSLIDYLHLDSEYLLLLLAHCVKIGKKSIRYVESCAISLYDEGVTDVKALEERLKQREKQEEAEGKIRELFGMRSRALTSKERKMIENWLFSFHYDIDVITLAYEMTVNAIGNPSVPYTNSIMERWASENLHTLAEIKTAEAARAGHGQNDTAPGNSFNTDAFFDAALKRSFGDDYQPAGGKRKP